MELIRCFPRYRDCLENLGNALWNSLLLQGEEGRAGFAKDVWEFDTRVADRLRSLGNIACTSEDVAVPIIREVHADIVEGKKKLLVRRNSVATSAILETILLLTAAVADSSQP